jgi:hypothetical protein
LLNAGDFPGEHSRLEPEDDEAVRREQLQRDARDVRISLSADDLLDESQVIAPEDEVDVVLRILALY